MKFKALIGTSILAMAVATPAYAQDAEEEVARDAFGGEIVVTAQRQSERLQDVPIAVSAFSTESLEAQQIENPSDLQLVRRQNIWHNSRRKLAECGPRQGLDFKRRACGVASADIRWSVV